ncbi:probable cytochrome P450 28c1 [Drosophila santomea]|uniref:probable cytochrome P450 28c1 n=1 Tax=Drosophila santomea TaxID=129105 RepID=UPI001952D673|nr:probable cytochrome P450 28c1 [Drosophila santomea]
MFGSLLLGIATLLGIIYAFLVSNFGHWRRRGVTEPKALPLFGSFPSMVWPRQHFTMDMRDIYMRYRHTHSYVGCYLLRAPKLLVLEPRLVYEIYVSAFSHFENNDASKMVDIAKDRLVALNPFVLEGEEWRHQRAVFSTLLTNGRIRTTHAIMQRVCQDLCQFIAMKSAGGKELDCIDLGLRFTGESLFDCVLGIQARTFTDNPLPVVRQNHEMSAENRGLAIAGAVSGLFPNLPRWLRPKVFPRSHDQFYGAMISEALRLRRSKHQERNDFINHLLEMQRELDLSEEDMASHAMTFMFDGLDTTSNSIAHCLLLLARNPDSQRRLVEELQQVSSGGDLPDLDALIDLPYLSACFNESLRIYPAGGWASKSCTKEYELRGSHHAEPLKLRPGDNVMVPIYALHNDPDHYPEPEVFRPERFLDGGLKTSKQQGIFLGFGNGPRQCVGMRLGLAMAKAALAAIVQRFEVLVSPRTLSGTEIDPMTFVGVHKGGIWLQFVPRQNWTRKPI